MIRRPKRNKRVRNASADIRIDKTVLEDECLEQPSLYMYYSEKYAEALETKETAKQRVELVYAQTESKIRKDWKLYFEKQPTEPAIKGEVLQDPYYRKAQNLSNKANKTANVLKGIVTSFDHRKKALENVISLRVTGYYAEPKPRQVQKQREGRSRSLKNRIIKKQ